MVPVYQSFWNIFSTLGGIIYFQEYREFHVSQTICFITGLCITYSGVVYLLKERTKDLGSPLRKYQKVASRVDEGDRHGESTSDAS